MKFLILLIAFFNLPHLNIGVLNSCYDANGRAQKCVPEFQNAAFNLTVEATNTCGLTEPQEFCLQTGVTWVRKSCWHICDAQSPRERHPAKFMTDFNYQNNWTWWQSETMLERRNEWWNGGILISKQQLVNLTLSLGKAYDVTYIRLRFHSPRPESFAIYKRTTADGPWIPYQFYSASCKSTYKLENKRYVGREQQDEALCTDEYSDISPLTGGEVPFSTLEGRPDARNFEQSPVLQEWVTATDIRIVLTRMNTFGDEAFGDPRVLRSYYYAIDDLAVGARCKCNGHGMSCSIGPDSNMRCDCSHNTTGPNCDRCLPFYNDRPWARATEDDAMECLPCDCKGMSNECYFDEELYNRTGHGGHCINCLDNRGGIHCEQCLPNHYINERTNRCTPCYCDETGSEDLQCDEDGQCLCKPGVTGQYCERCEDNYYEFNEYGCRPCGCFEDGSSNNYPKCDSETGQCVCKEFVEGQNCDNFGKRLEAMENLFRGEIVLLREELGTVVEKQGFIMKTLTETIEKVDNTDVSPDKQRDETDNMSVQHGEETKHLYQDMNEVSDELLRLKRWLREEKMARKDDIKVLSQILEKNITEKMMSKIGMIINNSASTQETLLELTAKVTTIEQKLNNLESYRRLK